MYCITTVTADHAPNQKSFCFDRNPPDGVDYDAFQIFLKEASLRKKGVVEDLELVRNNSRSSSVEEAKKKSMTLDMNCFITIIISFR